MSMTPHQFHRELLALDCMTSAEQNKVGTLMVEKHQPLDSAVAGVVDAGIVTKFQADKIASGDGAELVIDDYVLRDVLGEGGMGRVYLAWHRRMDRLVALKMVSPRLSHKSLEIQTRFAREIKALASLSHPHIVVAFDAGEYNHQPYLVTEYVRGISLEQKVVRDGPLTCAEAASVIEQTARGLAYAHQRGIVHRDIKPANLLLNEQGQIKILDLGVAKMMDPDTTSHQTRVGDVLGTPAFMSPEQWLGQHLDQRSDIYSLGATWYFLLHGTTMFERRQLEPSSAADQIFALYPVPCAENAHHERLFQLMVATPLGERLDSAEAVIEMLTGARSSHSCEAYPPLVPGSLSRRKRLAKLCWLGLAAMLMATSAWYLLHSKWPDTSSSATSNSGSTDSATTDSAASSSSSPPLDLPNATPLSLAPHATESTAVELLGPLTPPVDHDRRPSQSSPVDLSWLGSEPRRLAHHTDVITSLCFSPNGNYLASVAWDGTLVVWRLADQSIVWSKDLSGQAILALTFSMDSQQLLSATDAGSIMALDVATGDNLQTWSVGGSEVHCLLALPDQRIASGDSQHAVKIWDFDSGTVLTTFEGHQQAVEALVPLWRLGLLVSGDSSGEIRLWPLPDAESVSVPAIESKLSLYPKADSVGHSLAGSPVAGLLAAGHERSVAMWDVEAGRELWRTPEMHPQMVWGLAFSADARLLASVGGDQAIKIWSAESGDLLAHSSGGHAELRRVVFSITGPMMLAAGAVDGTILLYGPADTERAPERVFERQSRNQGD